MTTLNIKINTRDTQHFPFDMARAIVQNMKDSDPTLAAYAFTLLEDRLFVGDNPPIGDMFELEYTESKPGKNGKTHVYVSNAKDVKAALFLERPARLISLINRMEASYDQWLIDLEIERETEKQVKTRVTEKQTKHESPDLVIAGSDIPSKVNAMARKLATHPASGRGASYDRLFESLNESDMIAMYRAFNSFQMADDTRRMTAYRTALKDHGLSLQDVQTTWDGIDNPPKTRTTSRKANPSEQPKKAAKAESLEDRMTRLESLIGQIADRL